MPRNHTLAGSDPEGRGSERVGGREGICIFGVGWKVFGKNGRVNSAFMRFSNKSFPGRVSDLRFKGEGSLPLKTLKGVTRPYANLCA